MNELILSVTHLETLGACFRDDLSICAIPVVIAVYPRWVSIGFGDCITEVNVV